MPPAKKTLKKTNQDSTSKVNPEVDEEGTDETELDETNVEGSDQETDGSTEPAPEDPHMALVGQQNDDADLAPAYERLVGAPKDGRAFQPGEPVILEGIQRGGLLIVQKPVYRAAKTPGSSRWRYHLLLSRGAEISMAKVQEIGEREDEKKPGTFQTDQSNLY